MELQRQHEAVKMKETICTVILITQALLCSNISATKRVITHVTIKSLAGIPANNYAVMKSVKILTVEGGAYIKLLRHFSLRFVLHVRLSFLSKKCWARRSHTVDFQSRQLWKARCLFPSEPWGDGAPQTHTRSCLPMLFTHSAQWGTVRAMFMCWRANYAKQWQCVFFHCNQII